MNSASPCVRVYAQISSYASRSVIGSLGEELRLWPTNGSNHPALSPAAVESIRPVRLESRDHRPRGHIDPLEHFAGLRIDSPKLSLGALRRAVPQLVLDPRDTGDKAIRLDRAKYRARLGIDLMNLARAILSHPERPFSPRQS